MCTLFLAVLMLPFFVFAEEGDSTKLYERNAIYSVSGVLELDFYKCNDVAKRVKFVPLNENDDTSKEITGNGA